MKNAKNMILICALFTLANGSARAVSLSHPPQPFSVSDTAESVSQESFTHRDHEGRLAIERYNNQNEVALSEYVGLNDFQRPTLPGDSEFPWRDGPFTINGKTVAKLDLTKKHHAKYFSDMVFQYILDGWFTDEHGRAIENRDDQFRQNHVRNWCTTPGVVDGDGGREAVHGLTKELGLKPNPLFPAGEGADGFTEDLWLSANKLKRPAGWGQPFYNSVVCEQYQYIFGNRNEKRLPIMNQQDLLDNQSGFVSFKLHFNAMAKWQSYRPFYGAYTWLAHAGNTRGQKTRRLQSIPLIQISVSMKLNPKYIDGLKDADGSDKADYWVMLAYYHDSEFTNSTTAANNLPDELRHMRPMGVQTGFTPRDSIIFEDAKSNYKMNNVDRDGTVTGVTWHANDKESLLNGPADNAYSSCMGCHAGFNYMNVLKAKDPRRGGADALSFYDTTRFKAVRKQQGKGVDFNLQLYNVFGRIEAWLAQSEEEDNY